MEGSQHHSERVVLDSSYNRFCEYLIVYTFETDGSFTMNYTKEGHSFTAYGIYTRVSDDKNLLTITNVQEGVAGAKVEFSLVAECPIMEVSKQAWFAGDHELILNAASNIGFSQTQNELTPDQPFNHKLFVYNTFSQGYSRASNFERVSALFNTNGTVDFHREIQIIEDYGTDFNGTEIKDFYSYEGTYKFLHPAQDGSLVVSISLTSVEKWVPGDDLWLNYGYSRHVQPRQPFDMTFEARLLLTDYSLRLQNGNGLTTRFNY